MSNRPHPTRRTLRVAAFVLATAFAFVVTGCNGSSDDKPTGNVTFSVVGS